MREKSTSIIGFLTDSKSGEGMMGSNVLNYLDGIAGACNWRNPENMCKHNLWMSPLLVKVTRKKSIHNCKQ